MSTKWADARRHSTGEHFKYKGWTEVAATTAWGTVCGAERSDVWLPQRLGPSLGWLTALTADHDMTWAHLSCVICYHERHADASPLWPSRVAGTVRRLMCYQGRAAFVLPVAPQRQGTLLAAACAAASSPSRPRCGPPRCMIQAPRFGQQRAAGTVQRSRESAAGTHQPNADTGSQGRLAPRVMGGWDAGSGSCARCGCALF